MDRMSASIVLFVIGVVTLLTGLVYGLGSRTVTYQQTQQGPIAHFLSIDGVGYVQMVGNSSLYIIREDDFRPVINANSFGDGDVVSLIYDPSATTSIDVTSQLGTHLLGDASKVVEVTLLTPNGLTKFITPDYIQHQDGYSINRWPIGGSLMVLGSLIVGIAALIFLRRKTNVNTTPTGLSSQTLPS